MKVSVMPAAELDGTLICCWREIQEADATFSSPLFCPEFTITAARFYPNTYVGVIEEGSSVVGFLPFERQWGRAGRAVAPGKSDYQGVIIKRDVEWSAMELIHKCGLRSLEFEHLIASQTPFQKYHTQADVSHVIDLSDGYESYVHNRKHSLKDFKRVRALEKDAGPVRLEKQNADVVDLRKLFEIKRQQYARAKMFDALKSDSVRGFLERLHAMREGEFRGMLTTLHAGDQLVAASFGVRSRTVMHGWLTAYDTQFSKYSPGTLLIEMMAQRAGDMGIRIIDMGHGGEAYKQRFANRTVPLAAARAGVSLPAIVRQHVGTVKRHLSGTYIERPALSIYRAVKRTVTPWFAVDPAKGAA